MKRVVLLTLLSVALVPAVHAATFGQVVEVFDDFSEREYVIRFLGGGQECLWSSPLVTSCPSPWCMASAAPPPNIPTCISLCSGGLWNMICPWEAAFADYELRRRIATTLARQATAD